VPATAAIYPSVPFESANDLASIGFHDLVRWRKYMRTGESVQASGLTVDVFAFDVRARARSIRINDQWRVCFRFADGDAFDVEITDYH
jgi:hypothetical protein